MLYVAHHMILHYYMLLCSIIIIIIIIIYIYTYVYLELVESPERHRLGRPALPGHQGGQLPQAARHAEVLGAVAKLRRLELRQTPLEASQRHHKKLR